MLRRHSILPGFGITLGLTMTYLSLIVLIPLSSLFVRSATIGFPNFVAILSDPRVAAAFRLTFGASLIAAVINAVFGLLLAWVLVRYSFPGRKIMDALVDLPFALPTAVAGISLTGLYASTGLIGSFLDRLGIKVAFTPLGITIALIFVSFPFVVRTIQPVLEDMEPDWEEAAATLGAHRWQTFWKVIFPALRPALVTGFIMAFARALGEYGSVIFISGNMPFRTEILPLLMVTKLEQYDYVGANVLAAAMLIVSFCILIVINVLQGRHARRFQ